MGVIGVRLSEKKEKEIRRLAHEEGKSISEYCRDKILSDYHIDESLDRETVEEQIQSLKKEISYLYEATDFLIKKSIFYGEANRYFINDFFRISTKNNEFVAAAWDKAKKAAEEEVKNLFK